MVLYLIIAVFVLCAAITSGSIVLLSHLKTSYKSEFLSPLLFFLVFYFTFGYYGIWGQMILASLLNSFASHEIIVKISDLMGFLGTPFLLVASLMYVKYTREVSGRKTSNLFIIIYLMVNLAVIVLLGYIGLSNPELKMSILLRYYLIALSSLFSIMGAYYFLYHGDGRPILSLKDMTSLAVSVLCLTILQNILLLVYDKHSLLALSFILLFFLTGGLSPVYIKYRADLSKLIPESEILQNFEGFFETHKISPREKEIIHEICKGLTNQEIADRLFISLQTVKDHTHRIYFKTDCSSRSQLIRKVNEYQ